MAQIALDKDLRNRCWKIGSDVYLVASLNMRLTVGKVHKRWFQMFTFWALGDVTHAHTHTLFD